MEQLGGLIHRMPRTAVAFLIGCAAISALPPLNGFVSEWLTFQAILVSPQMPQWGLRFLIPAVGALLALVGGAGGRLLRQGVRRHVSRAAAHALPPRSAREADGFSLAAMFVLAALCFVLRCPAGRGRRSAGAGGAEPGRRAACRRSPDLPWSVDRADRREPQLLQRPDHPGFPRLRPASLTARVHPSLRDAGDAAQRDLGLRLSRSVAGDAIHQLELRHADPPGVRHDRVRGARDGRHAAAGRDARRAVSRQGVRSGLALRSTGRSRARCCAPRRTLNRLQFLTIRRYLTLVFVTLILLLLVVAAWR